MPPAARNPFKKGFLDLPKLLLQGAHLLPGVVTLSPIGTEVNYSLEKNRYSKKLPILL
jgi:hypothetical protein